ncbi:hypothetical protein [Xanthomonas sp. BRIP62418]|uniref:hypothetical protein n=2 Tax=unclassified Xanthomonas TaxID=2643310 RepID=UPI0013DEE284|nr:hypothetical protein [Xanthomonas sp. BRIP62418]
MNIAIMSKQITLQCSIAGGGGSARALRSAAVSFPASLPAGRPGMWWSPIYVEIRSCHERFL